MQQGRQQSHQEGYLWPGLLDLSRRAGGQRTTHPPVAVGTLRYTWKKGLRDRGVRQGKIMIIINTLLKEVGRSEQGPIVGCR